MPRLSPGPVFVHESIAAARRWQNYALRSFFVLGLLAGLCAIWVLLFMEGQFEVGATIPLAALAQLGSYFYYVIATVQVVLVLLVAPAATAGAICQDRAGGMLSHTFVTELTNREIVLGKLGARLLPVFALVAASVPVLCLTGLLGGIIMEALVTLTAVTLALAVFGCALALAFSVRASKINEVLMAVFTIWTVWIVGIVIWEGVAAPVAEPPDWYWKLNPFVLAWAPYAWPTYLGPWDVWIAVALFLGLSLLLVGYTVWHLRREVAPARATRARRWRLPRLGGPAIPLPRLVGPTLDNNPVLWREWRRNRSSRITRVVWTFFTTCTVLGTAWGLVLIAYADDELGCEFLSGTAMLSFAFGLLLVSLAAPTALAEERSRGSLDVLMTTPLSTPSIVLGKWLGAFRLVPLLVIVPAIAAIAEAITTPGSILPPRGWKSVPYDITIIDRLARIFFGVLVPLAQGAVVTSFGHLLASWFRRPGRAVAFCVSAYVLFTFGWVILVEIGGSMVMLFMNPGTGRGLSEFETISVQALTALSPLLGGEMISLRTLSEPSYLGTDPNAIMMLTWLSFGLTLWILVSVASGLLALNILTFNRWVGRASERARKASKVPLLLAKRAARRTSRTPQVAAVRG
jgi:ABC-type transport system involved in multi-copper enzyme maturation permease subunit